MSDQTDNVFEVLVLIDRLAALIQNLGARVRQAQAEGRVISNAELDSQADQVELAIADTRADIAAARARRA